MAGLMKRKGFTLIEIIIVIAVMLILGGAAFGGAREILRTLRFNNAFNKLVLVIQQARNLAVTNKTQAGTAVIQYVVNISKQTRIVRFFADMDGDGYVTSAEEVESYSIPTNDNIILVANDTALNAPCIEYASIIFTLPSAQTKLVCGAVAIPFSATVFVSQLTLGTQETTTNGRTKTFTIHEAAGIPQI